MACSPTSAPYALNYPGMFVNFDGSNICVALTMFDGDSENINISRTYPIGTSDFDIVEDLRNELLGQISSDFLNMTKRLISIHALLLEALVR